MPPFYEYIAVALLVIIVASRFYHKGREQGYEDCRNDHKEFVEGAKEAGRKIEEDAFLRGQYCALEMLLGEAVKNKEGETKNEQKESEQRKSG